MPCNGISLRVSVTNSAFAQLVDKRHLKTCSAREDLMSAIGIFVNLGNACLTQGQRDRALQS
jgi:hypothetical protein